MGSYNVCLIKYQIAFWLSFGRIDIFLNYILILNINHSISKKNNTHYLDALQRCVFGELKFGRLANSKHDGEYLRNTVAEVVNVSRQLVRFRVVTVADMLDQLVDNDRLWFVAYLKMMVVKKNARLERNIDKTLNTLSLLTC